MRSLLKIITVLVFIIMVSACATTAPQIPEKYALDNQLEQVERVRGFRITGEPAFTTFEESFEDPLTVMGRRDTLLLNKTASQWIEVDQQSLIVQPGPKEFYLLILQIPAPELLFSEVISIYSMGTVIKAGADYIQFPQYKHNLRYPIVRIYRINSLEQMRAIRDQLKG
jgi:hypothetical protein